MSLMLDTARVAAVVNTTFLVGLIIMWAQTYREIRAPLTLGSIIFATLLLAENIVALYFYLTAPTMPRPAVQFMMILQLLETVAIAVLTYVTWQ
ncbi:MAG: hypothetical protein J07HQW1_01928 [Haloquadratum walsbyi J07HQW1]|uniref:GGDEF domain-containing protein n=1 Tax=Haloquadratum walsbyi J07HQW1 TaxID=1238424 RepID=U1MPM9_9EURY|nr:MAG: hypothetical protein J07HQW1_01928 [Haloquadratum walsbyi J07HQW1]